MLDWRKFGWPGGGGRATRTRAFALATPTPRAEGASSVREIASSDPEAQLGAAVFITNGLPVLGALLIQTLFVCKYSSIAAMPFSRPNPELL